MTKPKFTKRFKPEDYDPAVVQNFFDNYYQDRGVVKWQGFFLSDHTAALKQQAKDEATTIEPASPQTPDKIQSIVYDCWQGHHSIRIQFVDVDTNGNVIELEGTVRNADEDEFLFESLRNPQMKISYDEIRHAWYN